jgi:hypothetical protein
MKTPHILYVITTPEDKIFHHIAWNQQQHPTALFAIVAMNPIVDQWLRQKKVDCSLVQGDLPYSSQRLEIFHHIMQGPFFQNLTMPGSTFSFWENIPVDRLLQFFQLESRQKEQEILGNVELDEMVCTFDLHHPVIPFLVKKASKKNIPITAIQCGEIRIPEMLDISLTFSHYIVDLDEDRDFLIRELGVEGDSIEVAGKPLFDAIGSLKGQMSKVSNHIARDLNLTHHDRGIFLMYDCRHNWEIRRFLRIIKELNHAEPNLIMLYVYCTNSADVQEFQILFREEIVELPYQLLPSDTDITIVNHCFPIWLSFRWNRDLEIAARLGQRVLLFDPFDFNCTSRMGIDDIVWKIARTDDDLREVLQKMPLELVK